jgi:hypothetical protein
MRYVRILQNGADVGLLPVNRADCCRFGDRRISIKEVILINFTHFDGAPQRTAKPRRDGSICAQHLRGAD